MKSKRHNTVEVNESSAFDSMLEINAASQLTGQKAIEAEVTSVDCGATKWAFHEPQKTNCWDKRCEMVCPQLPHKYECIYMHEIMKNKLYLCRNDCLYECVYVSCISLYIYMMCSLYSIYTCIQLYSATGIDNVTLNKKMKFVCLFVWKWNSSKEPIVTQVYCAININYELIDRTRILHRN